jgi:hypothetical protein
VSFLITIPIHLHSYFFLISSVASSAPFGQELVVVGTKNENHCGWYNCIIFKLNEKFFLNDAAVKIFQLSILVSKQPLTAF